mmetsp:Transcript_4061/g.9136  ORF Transcript_4061/g.9136 Transcript_4061/m.9136 type:complete len:102 (-) Transcript_4061:1422-1727(-)
MSYHKKTHIPENIKLQDYEHPKIQKLRGDPPIRIVPKFLKKDNANSEFHVVVIKTRKDKDLYPKFTGDTDKDAIRHLLLYWSLVKKLEIKYHQMWSKMKKA